MSKISYPTIPNDVIVDIQVSGLFYNELLKLQLALAETVTLDQYKAVLEQLKSDKPVESVFSLTVHNLMAIIYEIETKAKAQNKIKMVDVEPETNES